MEAVFKYDLLENNSIFVYANIDDNLIYLGEAVKTDKYHPAAQILGTDEDVQNLNDALRHKNSLKNGVVRDAKQFLKNNILPETKKHLEDANIISLHEPKSKNNTDHNTSSENKNIKKRQSSFMDKLSYSDTEEDNKRTNTFFKHAAEE